MGSDYKGDQGHPGTQRLTFDSNTQMFEKLNSKKRDNLQSNAIIDDLLYGT